MRGDGLAQPAAAHDDEAIGEPAAAPGSHRAPWAAPKTIEAAAKPTQLTDLKDTDSKSELRSLRIK